MQFKRIKGCVLSWTKAIVVMWVWHHSFLRSLCLGCLVFFVLLLDGLYNGFPLYAHHFLFNWLNKLVLLPFLSHFEVGTPFLIAFKSALLSFKFSKLRCLSITSFLEFNWCFGVSCVLSFIIDQQILYLFIVLWLLLSYLKSFALVKLTADRWFFLYKAIRLTHPLGLYQLEDVLVWS